MTTTTSTSTVTALGAGSGVDIAALAKSLVDAERAPAKAVIDKKVTAATNSVSGYAAIKYVLDNLKTAFADLKDQSDFGSLAPSISQPSALSVAAGATTAAGSHTVTVSTLAAAQRNVSAGFAAAAKLNGGTAFNLTLRVGSDAAKTITVSEDTPAGIAAAINSANLGVAATLVNTGSASAPYKIMVTGTTGAANSFTLTSDNVPSCVTAVTTQGVVPITGVSGVRESAALTFSDLQANQSVTIGGLTYTANQNITADALAAAFASLGDGATTGAGTATGSYSGALTGFSTGALTNGTVQASSSSLDVNVSDLVISDSVPSCVTAVTTQGVAPITSVSGVRESAALTFADLNAGQSVTIGGLTYTATKATTAAELAAAFASLNAGATIGGGIATGSYSGTLTGFSTGAVTNGTVIASSTTSNANVDNLAIMFGGLGFGNTALQAASDATLTVDGVAITSSSNQVQGAISGATLNLTGTTSGAATLNFTRDAASVKTKLQALVTAYNDANSMLGVVSDPKSSVATYGATLVGNSIVSQVRDQIRNIMLPNATSSSGSITSLRDLGVSIDKTGVLTLDATTLDSALNNKFDQVVTMLSADRENLSTYSTLSAGVAGEAVKKLTTMLASTGSISAQSANATKKISDYNADLAKLETRMTDLLARYNKQFAAMDSIVGQTNSLRTNLTATFDGMMSMYTKK